MLFCFVFVFFFVLWLILTERIQIRAQNFETELKIITRNLHDYRHMFFSAMAETFIGINDQSNHLSRYKTQQD